MVNNSITVVEYGEILGEREQFKQNRKLQISGGSTYIISIPKSWVETMNLKAGDSISMINNENNSLTVFPASDGIDGKQAASIVVGPNDSDESIRRKIVAMYLAGYKSITIAARGIRLGPGQINAVRSFARSSMIGTEIIESSPECVTIKTLTRLPEMSFDVALLRMATMTIDAHQEALEALEAADTEYADEVVKLDDEIDRFTFYMLRNLTMAVGDAGLLRAMSLEGPADCLYYRTVISRIERIADHATLIAKRVKYLTEHIDTDIVDKTKHLSRSVMEMFSRSIDAMIRADYGAAEKVTEAATKAQAAQEELMMSVKDSAPNATVIKFVLDSIRRSAEYTMDIAEVVMDRNIKSVIADTGPSRVAIDSKTTLFKTPPAA